MTPRFPSHDRKGVDPLEVAFATPADDAAIRGLLRRQTMPGRIRITYEREPNFWVGCETLGDDCRVLVAREPERGEVVGLASRSTRRVFVNGVEQRLGYLSQLRIDHRFRGRWLLSRGFSLLRQLHDGDPLPGYLASIVTGNREAGAVLVERRRRGFPVFRPVAEFCSLAIAVCGARRVECPGPPVDPADVARFLQSHGRRRQFFPVWTDEALRRLSSLGLPARDLRVARRDGEIEGVAGLWDQSAYKQTVVQGYPLWMRAVGPVYNLAAPRLGRPSLPGVGGTLRSAYASLICVADDDVAVFRGLLRELYDLAAARGFEYLLVGLDSRDPLLQAAREYSHVFYPSRLYLAEWSGGGNLFEQLDGRPVYLDIATL